MTIGMSNDRCEILRNDPANDCKVSHLNFMEQNKLLQLEQLGIPVRALHSGHVGKGVKAPTMACPVDA